jgi:hypothetical protein
LLAQELRKIVRRIPSGILRSKKRKRILKMELAEIRNFIEATGETILSFRRSL